MPAAMGILVLEPGIARKLHERPATALRHAHVDEFGGRGFLLRVSLDAVGERHGNARSTVGGQRRHPFETS
ncbi:hypothetical protein D3C78_1608050 [compost metagenome]